MVNGVWTGGGRLNLCCGVWCEIDLVAESRLNKFNAGHDRAPRRSTESGGSTQVVQIDHRWEKVLRFVMISIAVILDIRNREERMLTRVGHK